MKENFVGGRRGVGQSCDVAIVGGGLAGLAAAYALQERGRSVTVLDRRPGPGEETSFANGSLLTAAMSDPWNAPGVERHLARAALGLDSDVAVKLKALPSLMVWGLRFLWHARPEPHRRATVTTFDLARRSIALTLSLQSRMDGWSAEGSGLLKVFRDSRALDRSLAATRLIGGRGMSFSILDGPGVVALEPALAPVAEAITGGLFYPEDAWGDAHGFCAALARRLEARGADLRWSHVVRAVRAENGRVTGLDTDHGPLDSASVVVAAGMGSERLTRPLGPFLSIRPAKGYSLTFRAAEGAPRRPVIDDALHAVVTPLGDRVRVAGTAEFAGEDLSLSGPRVEALYGVLRSMTPALEPVARAAPDLWAGLRPMTADGLPVIGPAPLPGLWISAGYGHLGWTLAMGAAELLADLMQAAPPRLDPTPFRVRG